MRDKFENRFFQAVCLLILLKLTAISFLPSNAILISSTLQRNKICSKIDSASEQLFVDYNIYMGKKYIAVIFIIFILFLAGGGFYYWKVKMQKQTTDVNSQTESVQSANPYDSTNPFSNIKVNPFE